MAASTVTAAGQKPAPKWAKMTILCQGAWTGKDVQGLYFSPLPLPVLQEPYHIAPFTKSDGNLYGSLI